MDTTVLTASEMCQVRCYKDTIYNQKLFQIIHTILMLIAFTYIIAVNLNSLSQILCVHVLSLKNKGYHLQNESN